MYCVGSVTSNHVNSSCGRWDGPCWSSIVTLLRSWDQVSVYNIMYYCVAEILRIIPKEVKQDCSEIIFGI